MEQAYKICSVCIDVQRNTKSVGLGANGYKQKLNEQNQFLHPKNSLSTFNVVYDDHHQAKQ